MRLRRSDFALWDVPRRMTWRTRMSNRLSDDWFTWSIKRAKDSRGVYAILDRTPVLTLVCGIAMLCHEAQFHHGRDARIALRRSKRIITRRWPDLDAYIERIPALMRTCPQ